MHSPLRFLPLPQIRNPAVRGAAVFKRLSSAAALQAPVRFAAKAVAAGFSAARPIYTATGISRLSGNRSSCFVVSI